MIFFRKQNTIQPTRNNGKILIPKGFAERLSSQRPDIKAMEETYPAPIVSPTKTIKAGVRSG